MKINFGLVALYTILVALIVLLKWISNGAMEALSVGIAAVLATFITEMMDARRTWLIVLITAILGHALYDLYRYTGVGGLIVAFLIGLWMFNEVVKYKDRRNGILV